MKREGVLFFITLVKEIKGRVPKASL